jgi:3-methyl-2-oxobutanoate hydroxymethyltransferase
VPAIRNAKGKEPVVMLTAYTVRMAQILDPHCDMLLVGDSLGQVIYGLPSSVPVSLEMMIAHGAAVVRGSYHSLVVIDMPFGCYEESPEQAFRSAARILKETGAAAVKLEGGEAMAETVTFLTERGVPVVGHVGLTPQAVNILGGYGARGRSEAERAKLIRDAQAIAEAGAFAVVVEGVVEPIAVEITRAIAVPTIGIGGSVECDGQVLVIDDMLGMFDRVPRFVKKYARLADQIDAAAAEYAADVRARRFPTAEQTYQPKG